MRILIAEDEKDLNRIITSRLKAEHYSVDSCFDGREALEYLESAEYDALVLDIMMPVLDGLSVLKQMRRRNDSTPVILLTAKDSIEDRVSGLDAGANDYLVKPFAFEELLARIRVLLRKPAETPKTCYKVADLEVHMDTQQVKRGGKEIKLSGKEFALLRYMVQNEGIVLSRDRLEQHLWNFDYAGGSNVIDVYIRYLRKKIDEGYDQKLIHTVRGSGYVLRAEPFCSIVLSLITSGAAGAYPIACSIFLQIVPSSTPVCSSLRVIVRVSSFFPLKLICARRFPER